MSSCLMQNVNDEERELIESWIKGENCEGIRNYFYGFVVQDRFKKQALLLDKMFDKYDSGLPKKEPIYRGLRFNASEKYKLDVYEKTKKMLYDAYKNGGVIQIDNAPSSFTLNRKIAFDEFAWNSSNVFKSIVYVLIERNANELYLEGFNDRFANEEEIVIKSHKTLYSIVSIEVNEYDTMIVKLKEDI